VAGIKSDGAFLDHRYHPGASVHQYAEVEIRFFMNVGGKHILVVGLGKSGLSAVRWLAKQGARVEVSEIRGETDLDPRFLQETRDLGVNMETGGHRRETFLRADTVVVSPGVPLDTEALRAATQKGIPVLGEMELACRIMKTPMVAITGTNGKSTVTALVGEIMSAQGLKVFVGGNLGTPLIEYAAGDQGADYAVVEVSSFQLDTMSSFHPRVAVLLNISPDHLDRYPDYRSYVQSKLSIFRNQGSGDWAVLNDGDRALHAFKPGETVAVLRYGREKRGNRQAYLKGNRITAALPGKGLHEFVLDPCTLPGEHNRENIMAAVLAGLCLGVQPAMIQQTIGTFRGLPHRLEFAGSLAEVDFYDDSKATNVDAALRSVKSFDAPIILIAGGRDKGAAYSSLVEAARGRVRKAVLMGESRFIMAGAFEGVIPYSMAQDMTDAVAQAFSSARPQDVVLLAPACSSFDMFTDYGHRGRVFKEAVERLRDGKN
jgi:UDP-N-acetylmuramoylalanine--D-glutamate ligase